MSGIVIRQALLEDASAIYHIIQAGFARYQRIACPAAAAPALSETIADIQKAIRESYVLLAEKNSVPCGTLRVTPTEGLSYISRFAVLRQGIGIGGALLSAAAEFAMMQGANGLALHTDAHAVETLTFYQNAGFSVVSASTDRGYTRLYLEKIF